MSGNNSFSNTQGYHFASGAVFSKVCLLFIATVILSFVQYRAFADGCTFNILTISDGNLDETIAGPYSDIEDNFKKLKACRQSDGYPVVYSRGYRCGLTCRSKHSICARLNFDHAPNGYDVTVPWVGKDYLCTPGSYGVFWLSIVLVGVATLSLFGGALVLSNGKSKSFLFWWIFAFVLASLPFFGFYAAIHARDLYRIVAWIAVGTSLFLLTALALLWNRSKLITIVSVIGTTLLFIGAILSQEVLAIDALFTTERILCLLTFGCPIVALAFHFSKKWKLRHAVVGILLLQFLTATALKFALR